jgi:hypothetical protein
MIWLANHATILDTQEHDWPFVITTTGIQPDTYDPSNRTGRIAVPSLAD